MAEVKGDTFVAVNLAIASHANKHGSAMEGFAITHKYQTEMVSGTLLYWNLKHTDPKRWEQFNLMAKRRGIEADAMPSLWLMDVDLSTNKIRALLGYTDDPPQKGYNLVFLCVDSTSRKQGYGTRILQALVDRLPPNAHLYAEVEIDQQLLTFYAKCGFSIRAQVSMMEQVRAADVPGDQDLMAAKKWIGPSRTLPELALSCLTLAVQLLNELTTQPNGGPLMTNKWCQKVYCTTPPRPGIPVFVQLVFYGESDIFGQIFHKTCNKIPWLQQRIKRTLIPANKPDALVDVIDGAVVGHPSSI